MDDDGNPIEQQRYLPFGQARSISDDADVSRTDFTYTGQREIKGSGLMDFKARFYDPLLSRFISPDSIIPGAGDPQAWNRYSYVLNSPIGFTDPTGHAQRKCDGYGCKILQKKLVDLANRDETTSLGDEDNSGLYGGGNPPPQGVPQAWVDWLMNHIKWIWKTGPNWLFTDNGRNGKRIITFNHPHGYTETDVWHFNTDVRNINHSTNAEPALQKVADIKGSIETDYYMVKTAFKEAMPETSKILFAGATALWNWTTTLAAGEVCPFFFFVPVDPLNVFPFSKTPT